MPLHTTTAAIFISNEQFRVLLHEHGYNTVGEIAAVVKIIYSVYGQFFAFFAVAVGVCEGHLLPK